MPLTFPSTPTNGDTYTDDNSVVWQFDGVKWNVITGTTKHLYNGARVGFSLNYQLTETLTALNWDVESIDTDNYFNIGEPSKIVIPATGYYHINMGVFSDNSGSSYHIELRLNGSIEISQVLLNPNQSAAYNETQFFNQGDYLQLWAHELGNAGSLTLDTYLEITLMGLALGTGVSNYSAFSGVRTDLNLDFSTTTVATPIIWTGTDFDTNANALAQTYWLAGQPTRITVKTNGYYQLSSTIQTAISGGIYSISLRKNGTITLSSAAISPNDLSIIHTVYQLNANDYLEILVSDTSGSGAITTETYMELLRMGYNI